MANPIPSLEQVINQNLAHLFGGVLDQVEPAQFREERLSNLYMYQAVKIAGYALTAIAGIGAIFAVLSGSLITTLLACGLGAVFLDLTKIGGNGERMNGSWGEMFRSMLAAQPRIASRDPAEARREALYEGTLIIGPCYRFAFANPGN